MSRVGKNPINIPEKVQVNIKGDFIEVTGPLGKLSSRIHPTVKVKNSDGKISIFSLKYLRHERPFKRP